MSQNLNSAVAVIGIDIGKNSFHVVGLDDRGAIVLRQKWSRGQIEARLANLPPCLIGMEACVGAHHLSRKLKALGHDARLMPAKYVRPYSKGQKNDFRDAEAIAEAVQRPTMKFVATKTAEQLDLQALHRVRERLVSQRTGIINQIRAFLLERGVAISSAMVAAIGTGDAFAKGRDFAAWLGLVPKQMSTGDRTILGKISKRGNRYLRVLFVQAAWVTRSWERHGLKHWIEAARKRLHRNVLTIALANKLARIAWGVLAGSRAFEASKRDRQTLERSRRNKRACS